MNNLKHIWSILCGNSSIDQKTNNISIFNVLEQINVDKNVLDLVRKSQKNVVAAIDFQLITLWGNEKKGQDIKIEQKIEIVDAEGKVLGTASKLLEIPKTQKRLRVINTFNGLPITSVGDYLFKISLKDEQTGKFIEQTVLSLVVQANEENKA